MDDPFALDRFVSAQDGVYRRVVEELRCGRKQSHWMWFVFPQLAGLGRSPTARMYAISSLAEARAYVEHPVLGARLIECAGVLAELRDPGGGAGPGAEDIFGATDAVKLRSSMTLFARAAPEHAVFGIVLDRYFAGVADAATEELLAT